jgi:ferredoxin-thioredoxin reductase catalytic subunit
MITNFIKEGWELNPNSKVVNAILKRIDTNDGECPCVNPGKTREDRMCPCKEYRENDICHCGLYVKINNGSSS